MSNTEAMRADFEAWFKKQFHSRLDRNMPDKSYNDPLANTSWFVWQAATALATAGMKDRLLAALERAAAAETSLHLQATAPLEAAIKKVHAAKGRHHAQIAMCDLYELVGLPCVRPDAIRKAKHD